MSIQSRRDFERREVAPAARPQRALTQGESDRGMAMALLRDGAISGHDMVQALAQVQTGGRLLDALLAAGGLRQEHLYKSVAGLLGLGVADLRHLPPDPRLVDRLGANFCMANHILPWRDGGGTVIIATASTEAFQQHFIKLMAVFGPVTHVLAPAPRIESALLALRGPHMARGAESLLPLKDSCREFRPASRVTWAVLAGLTLICLAALPLALTVLLLWAAFTLVLTAVMKLGAVLATLRDPIVPQNKVIVARLPVVSVMVGLYKESDIAARLVRRLGRLDYPRDKLDVLLVCEEDDHLTRNALRAAELPHWMRVVVAPRGKVKTKPRALNYGLTQCRGSIVGVYDAEDAPEPDQIRKVVERFHQRGPEVACLQGVLDFYNPRRNWLSRCFTIEYAAWFRVILPGLQRMGLPLPLGGTTLFFRREVLEKLGGWDAHNVTEDADLGMRLVRQGYRTELIQTTTFEEANCVALPWVKQRSRWVKGYMMTYITHMRSPLLMWRQMGTRAFLGFQVLFLGSLTQTLLAPLLWSMLTLQFGLGHPVTAWLDHGTITALSILFILAEVLNTATGIIGLKRSGQRISWMWVPTLTLYFPLQALAGYKAFWELLRVPFYWDKTSHGALSAQKA
jgi:cellulose synthase/poly-beta-1,6-N-acetylglucosamine synthase-like glycosyltransferase